MQDDLIESALLTTKQIICGRIFIKLALGVHLLLTETKQLGNITYLFVSSACSNLTVFKATFCSNTNSIF